ncbi:hypothetical protein OC845_006701, partial [Tilletia horrida]
HLGIPFTGDLPQLETAYTPHGHITKTHIDGFWDGAILTCLFGSKLLLHWPSTAHNLNILGQQWPLSLRLGLHLISDLEGLKVYHMVHGSHVYLLCTCNTTSSSTTHTRTSAGVSRTFLLPETLASTPGAHRDRPAAASASNAWAGASLQDW